MIASVILPTFDESQNIIKLIKALRNELKKKDISNEIIIIDDNSPDKTGILAKKYFAKSPDIRIVIRKKERGLSSAIRQGIKLAKGKTIVVMDTDFNHEPKLVPKLIKNCKNYDFVIGSRYVKGGGMENRIRGKLSYLFNIFIRLILFSPVNDNLSGFFAINKDKLELLDYNKIFYGYGEYFIRLIYLSKVHNMTFIEVPCFYKNRLYGYSKSNFFGMFKDYMMTSLTIRFTKQ